MTGLDNLRRTFTLRKARQGEPFYLADEFGQKVWKYSVAKDGTLQRPELFAEEGELDLAVDESGNVYVAAGEIFVFNSDGQKIDTIRVPERPASLAFGGEDGRSLFIAARSSLYRIQLKQAGR